MVAASLWNCLRNARNLDYTHRATPVVEAATALVHSFICKLSAGSPGSAPSTAASYTADDSSASIPVVRAEYDWLIKGPQTTYTQALEYAVLSLWRLLDKCAEARRFPVPTDSNCYGETKNGFWQLTMDLTYASHACSVCGWKDLTKAHPGPS